MRKILEQWHSLGYLGSRPLSRITVADALNVCKTGLGSKSKVDWRKRTGARILVVYFTLWIKLILTS